VSSSRNSRCLQSKVSGFASSFEVDVECTLDGCSRSMETRIVVPDSLPDLAEMRSAKKQ